MMTTQFEKREVTRPASPDERADLMNRLLDVLSNIDITKEEAKAAASDYRGIIGDLHKREIGLRVNLQTGTVTQEIEVHPVANEATGMMEYFGRDGIEVVELRHELSQKQREQEALQRQMDMFGDEPADEIRTAQDIADLGERVGDIFNTSPAGVDFMPEYKPNAALQRRDELAAEVDYFEARASAVYASNQVVDEANTDQPGGTDVNRTDSTAEQTEMATSTTQPDTATAAADEQVYSANGDPATFIDSFSDGTPVDQAEAFAPADLDTLQADDTQLPQTDAAMVARVPDRNKSARVNGRFIKKQPA